LVKPRQEKYNLISGMLYNETEVKKGYESPDILNSISKPNNNG
jgi:hypothetical protein